MTYLSSYRDSFPYTSATVRVDINEDANDIRSSRRVLHVKKTVQYLAQSCEKVYIIAHKGRPDPQNPQKGDSIASWADGLAETWGVSLTFIPSTSFNEIEKKSEGKGVYLLENIRLFPGEYENSEELSEKIASLANVYINDAFSNSHRIHASMVGVGGHLPLIAGYGLEKEITHLKGMQQYLSDTILILGGAKIAQKLSVAHKLLPSLRGVIIGGGPANTLLKAKGWDIRESLCETYERSNELVNSSKVYIPTDVVWDTDRIVDIGPETQERYKALLCSTSHIMWNGPLGFLEKGYTEGTDSILSVINDTDIEGIIGGGETVSYIEGKILSDSIFLSTGGGALLAYLSEGSLIALDVLSS